MDSKTRANLRKEANTLEVVYHVGKEGIDANLIKGVGEVLKKRELIKLSVQENSPISAKQAADALAKELGADVIQVIGRKLVLFKQNPDNKKSKNATARW